MSPRWGQKAVHVKTIRALGPRGPLEELDRSVGKVRAFGRFKLGLKRA